MKDNQSTLAITINRLFYQKDGQIVVSALFGLALALIFRRVCKDNCVIYYAPDIKEVDNKIFKLEDTCYKYKPHSVKCNNKDKTLKVYNINTNPENQIIDQGLFSKIFS